MPIEVKICGLKTVEAVDASLEAGADYIGFVFYEPSPRNVPIEIAAELANRARGRAKIVALFVDPENALLERVIHDVVPDVIQLHGAETSERITDIRKMTNAEIMKAVKVANADDVRTARAYAGLADIILFDAKVAPGAVSDLPGGNGAAFDWDVLSAHDPSQPWMLSGGLEADTVAEAVSQTGATAVDVSSGVERARGEKDPALIHAFVAAIKAVASDGPDDAKRGVLTHV